MPQLDSRALHALSTAVLTILIGVYPVIRMPNRLTRLFALSNISLALWNLGDVLVLFVRDHDVLVFCYRATYLAGITTGWCFFQFIYAYAKVPLERDRRVWQTVKWMGIALIPLCFTPFLVLDLDVTFHPFKEIPGVAYPLLISFIGGGHFFSLYRLLTVYRAATGSHRRQLGYLLLALSFILAEAVFYFSSLYQESLPTYYFYFQVVYAAIIAYAIVKHQLLGVSVLLKRTFVYSSLTVLLATVYVSIITLLAALIGVRRSPSDVWPSAVAAGVIAILFHPLRTRIARWMDRRFRRESMDQELLREATSGFVHEIKKPLANISMPAQLVRQDLEQLRQKANVPDDVLTKAIKKLDYIVQESMEAGLKMEALQELVTNHTPVREDIDLTRILERAWSTELPRAERSAVQMEKQIDAIPTMSGNGVQLELAFANLIRNAIDAVSSKRAEQRLVSLTASQEVGSVIVTVRDTGNGIPKQLIERIFESHFTTKGLAGMGVGLTLAREIIRLHQGTLSVNSSQEGTTFTVCLPLFL